VRHACTAYLTFVHLGPEPGAALRPQPCPPFTPQTPAEQRRWAEALERRARRLERVKELKSSLSKGA
jgi:acyl-CoA hydrolase